MRALQAAEFGELGRPPGAVWTGGQVGCPPGGRKDRTSQNVGVQDGQGCLLQGEQAEEVEVAVHQGEQGGRQRVVRVEDHSLGSKDLQDREEGRVGLKVPVKRRQDLPLTTGDQLTPLIALVLS